MLKPVEEGGVSRYHNGSLTFEEDLQRHTILNGMIFSLWGLYDVYLATGEKEWKNITQQAVRTLSDTLILYDRGYWSNYDLDGSITSPFYHNLHIAQLQVMYDLFGTETFLDFLKKWTKYRDGWFRRKKAFVVKALQKLKTIDQTIVITK